MSVTINDELVLTRTFSGGRRLTTADEKYTTVPLKKGINRITLDNIGHDWINVGTVYFILNVESAADMITAHTHVADTAAMVYLENQTYSEVNQDILAKTPCDFTNVNFTLEGLTDGEYAVYPFNPNTGEYGEITQSTVKNGKVDISIPAVSKDYAVKLIKLSDGETPGEGSRFIQLQLTTRKPIEGSFVYPAIDSDGNGDSSKNYVIYYVIGGVILLLCGAAVALWIVKNKKKIPAEEE